MASRLSPTAEKVLLAFVAEQKSLRIDWVNWCRIKSRTGLVWEEYEKAAGELVERDYIVDLYHDLMGARVPPSLTTDETCVIYLTSNRR